MYNKINYDRYLNNGAALLGTYTLFSQVHHIEKEEKSEKFFQENQLLA
jgi:hypothetical protein